MKIGIIVHSHTGNTLSVAEKLKEKFLSAGHSVSLHRVSAHNPEETNVQKIQLNERPEIRSYDVLLFGAPVNAFSLSPVMQSYLSAIESLKSKKVACFMTQSFPFPWMGGNRSLKQMTDICQSKGAHPYEIGIVNWTKMPKLEKRINTVVEKLSRLP